MEFHHCSTRQLEYFLSIWLLTRLPSSGGDRLEWIHIYWPPKWFIDVYRKPEHDPNQRFLYLHFEQSPFLCAQKPLPDFWYSRSDSSKGEAQSGAGCVGFGLRLAVLVGVIYLYVCKTGGEAPCRGWTFVCSFSSWQEIMIVYMYVYDSCVLFVM